MSVLPFGLLLVYFHLVLVTALRRGRSHACFTEKLVEVQKMKETVGDTADGLTAPGYEPALLHAEVHPVPRTG